MIIASQKFTISDTLDSPITVPDCLVKGNNKIGSGNGEAKLYIASKADMYSFFGQARFSAHCFILKQDLIDYMNAIHSEYIHPSQSYRGADKMPDFWSERMTLINGLPDVIEFDVRDQDQIIGPRGYVKSSDMGYNLIREISLPLVSYLSVMRLEDKSGFPVFYWKLFADFDAISDKHEALVFKYGKKGETHTSVSIPKETSHQKEIRYARIGQGLYREKLLAECPFCPITMINDERLLIASHIKPWAVATETEKLDHKNGFILSPLYDKLFDKGFITFSEDRRITISNWLSPANKKRIGIKENQFVQLLPLDEERQEYMKFHRASVFKG